MAQITITIPDAKVAKAVEQFVRIYPNNTADPMHEDYVPHPTDPNEIGGISDRRWVQKRIRRWVRDTIHAGAIQEYEESRPPRDDTVVEEP